MEEIWEFGLTVIRAIQKIRCVPLDYLGLAIHYVCGAPIYIGLLCLLLWCVNYRNAVKMGVSLFLSCSVNDGIKDILKAPRPYTRDPSVGLATETSWSTPSGHSQSAASFFPVMADSLKNWKRAARLLVAVFVPILIGVSRMYVGVHYPTDVLLGLGEGFVFAIGVILFYDRIEAALCKLPDSLQILTVAVITFLLNMLGPENPAMSGGFFGLVTGYILLRKKGGFNAAAGTSRQKLLRFLLGAVVALIMYLGLKMMFPSEGSLRAMFRFVRYGICTFMASYVMPLVFIRLKLAEAEKAE